MVMKNRHETWYIYVEGGGDTSSLKRELREKMSSLLDKAGIKKNRKIIPSGTRRETYKNFTNRVKKGEKAILLVDSECAVAEQHSNKPWAHLKERVGDNWDQPDGTTDDHCHLMVECMESWFLADVDAVAKYFGQGFNEKHFPAKGQIIEKIEKKKVLQHLNMATRGCAPKKSHYTEKTKGEHSFKILGLIDPDKVKQAGAWAKRFFDTLNELCGQH